MANERRKHPRVSLEVDVDVTTENNFYAGKTRDLSMGGIFIEMPITPEVGTEIALKLALGKRRFDIVARCAWILTGPGGAPVGFGAEFTKLSPALTKAIETFMQKRDPMVFDLVEEIVDDDSEPGGPPPLPGGGKGPPPLPG